MLFFFLCLTPLLVLSVLSHWKDLRESRTGLQRQLSEILKAFTQDVRKEITSHDEELLTIVRSPAVLSYASSRSTGMEARAPSAAPIPHELQLGLATLLNKRNHFTNVTLYDRQRKPLFSAEPSVNDTDSPVVFRTEDLLSGTPEPHEKIWTSDASLVLHERTTSSRHGSTLCSTVAVSGEANSSVRPAALVGEIKLESLLDAVVKRWEFSADLDPPLSQLIVVLDQNGTILYHPNNGYRNKSVTSTMPVFIPVAGRMLTGETGFQNFFAPTGEEYETAFDSLPDLGLLVAVAANYSKQVSGPLHVDWAQLAIAALVAGVAATLLMSYSVGRRNQNLTTELATPITSGELAHPPEISSQKGNATGEIAPINESLREQIARETEARQFESFVKLSALLTHDLKNAIEALSLIVGNMERHFDNEEFRKDALKALTSSTDKLKKLVTRLSSPVTTLSGEARRPERIDLAPILKRVISLLGEPFRGTHRIELQIPDTLFALADAERIEKVFENLVLNALEAMSDQKGTLSVKAGPLDDDKVFFSIADTGIGISRDFIAERLFRPFATTKKHGVGLGLYTCREVVRAHQGTITVDSTEGVGTTFRVVLPSLPLKKPVVQDAV